jgi:tRNA A37 threonylcarbamoyltransferase TsaD
MIWPAVNSALKTAGISFKGLSCVTMRNDPGLIGSLLAGCCFVK